MNDLDVIKNLDFPTPVIHLTCTLADLAGIRCDVTAEWIVRCQRCGFEQPLCEEDKKVSMKAYHRGKIAWICPGCLIISSRARPMHKFHQIGGA